MTIGILTADTLQNSNAYAMTANLAYHAECRVEKRKVKSLMLNLWDHPTSLVRWPVYNLVGLHGLS